MRSVSIAMATFNGQHLIQRQLDSLVAQTHKPAELVITDDQSSDDTISVVEAFSRTAPFPVRVFRNETRLGYRKNFMHAASLCKSELIAFCDQDDYWHPQKVAVCTKPFSNPDTLLVYHNADIVTHDGVNIGSLSERAPKQRVLPPLSSGPWLHALGFTEVFRRSLLQLDDLWPQSLDQDRSGEPLAHDQWVFFLASVFGTIVYIDDPLVSYVQHGANTYGWGGRRATGSSWKSICVTTLNGIHTSPKRRAVEQIFSKAPQIGLSQVGRSELRQLRTAIACYHRTTF